MNDKDKALIDGIIPLPKAKRPPGRPRVHGVYSKKGLLPLANEKAALIIDIMSGEADMIMPQDYILVRLLARCLARIEMIDRYIEEHGIIADERLGDPQPVYTVYLREQTAALAMLDKLGLTPAARVRLGKDFAQGVDLAAGIQEARE